MATNPKATACKVYCDSMAAGSGVAESTAKAQKAHKVGHAILDLAWYADPRNTSGSATPNLNIAPADRAQACLDLRAGTGWNGALVGQRLSWGRITVALGYFNPAEPQSNEGQVRAQFGTHTGLASEGMRIGRGGRRLNNEPRFYTGTHKVHGVEDPKPRTLDPAEVHANAETYKPKVVAMGSARKATARKPRAKK